MKTTSHSPHSPRNGNTEIDFLGYRLSNRGLLGDVGWTHARVRSKATTSVTCLNPHSFVVASRDRLFAHAIKSSDLVIPDGIGVVWASAILQNPVPERVAGYEFFMEMTRSLTKDGGARYFFLGSSPQVLDRIAARLSRDFPSVTIAGSYSPPYADDFSPQENQKMLRAIATANADILWVGMTAPKQEKWIAAHREQIGNLTTVAIGAVFDFYAGTKARGPDWIRAAGLEWLPRLLREPKRLWRRNFVSTPLFILHVLKARRKIRKKPRQPKFCSTWRINSATSTLNRDGR